MVISEHCLQYYVDITRGQKTGFYIDQRDNRLLVRSMANSLEVLDCFCYSGGFSVNALTGGARSVVAVDTSAEALALGKENLSANNLGPERVTWLQADVFKTLRKFRDEGRRFDMIILDPGIGFGKSVEQNLELVNSLPSIRSLGYPILYGPSRKSFIGYTLDKPPDQRLAGTAAAVAVGIVRGADIIRIHDVKFMQQVAQMTDAIVR